MMGLLQTSRLSRAKSTDVPYTPAPVGRMSRLRSTRTGVAIALVLTLAACGARRDLRPQENTALPPAPYGATATPTPGQLLDPNTQQRPSRSDELLTESKARGDDPFALPPTH